ncbi:MAG: hypothetical protein OEY97_04085 [Nitrospirota bacterium]|nr:hypothetical protein [Nitrospirota bacterium]
MRKSVLGGALIITFMLLTVSAGAQNPGGVSLPDQSILTLQAEVNALKDAISGLSSGSPVRVFSADVAVGTVIGNVSDPMAATSGLSILTETGMMATISNGRGGYMTTPAGTLLPLPSSIGGNSVLFNGPGCTGDAFVPDPQWSPTPGEPGNGLALEAETGVVAMQAGLVGYIAPGTVPVWITPASTLYYDSYMGQGYCQEGGMEAWMYPALPNDPVVTGVPNSGAFAPPVRLGF